jgi:hypothetical protein
MDGAVGKEVRMDGRSMEHEMSIAMMMRARIPCRPSKRFFFFSFARTMIPSKRHVSF